MAKIDTVCVAITRNDGGITLLDFVTKEYASVDGIGWEREPSEENINAIIAKYPWADDCVSWKIIEKKDVPEDRTFRNAWKHDLSVDMPKAREIHKDKLRRDRAPLMAALDIEAIRANEEGDKAKKAGVVARKKVLRDITKHPSIEAASTPEELKAITIQ